eukprot:2745162-Amphidinium_carterae.1
MQVCLEGHTSAHPCSESAGDEARIRPQAPPHPSKESENRNVHAVATVELAKTTYRPIGIY